MSAPLLTLQNIALTFGGTPLLTDASLQIHAGERLCIVGRNGSGKSTLLKIAAGLVEPDRGTRFLQPGITLRYLPQEPDFGSHATTLDYSAAGLGPSDDPYQARFFLNELGLTGTENPATLSGGEGRRAALARTLAAQPDVILLDEPTNHLDIVVIEWLEATLKAMKSALVLISHDRRFLTNLSRRTVWVDRGRTRQFNQGFAQFESWRDETLAQEETDAHKLARKLEREADWLRYGVTARRKRNVRRLSALHAMRDQLRTRVKQQGAAALSAAEGSASGKLVIEAKDIAKDYGAGPVVAGFTTRILRGDRLGIAGANGAGKTTLLKMLTGQLAPDRGTVRLGTNLEIASLEQTRDSLKPEWTVADALTGGGGDLIVVNGQAKHVAAYMQDFLFQPEQLRTPVKVLSGGERARLMLARALAKPSNLLVLDEPTNDLDLETLDVLEEMLSDYTGTVILISHDRDFLDRIVTSTVVSEGSGRWIEYAGGYTDMLAQRREALQGKVLKDVTRREASPVSEAAPSAAPQPAKRKLSFKQKHALETLPKRIAELEARIASAEAELADPALYSRDRKRFDRLTASIAADRTALQTAEDEWLELELLREST
jgi:ATP-binding cassette subfamily F protein uup